MVASWANWEHVTKDRPRQSTPRRGYLRWHCGHRDRCTHSRWHHERHRSTYQPILDALSSTEIPIFVEPTYRPSSSHTEALSGYLLPIVLNAGDTMWITGAHHEWVRSSDLEWDYVHPEAYIVLNPTSSVATYTQADCDLDVDDVVAYAELAEQILGQQIVYLEYSGMLW